MNRSPSPLFAWTLVAAATLLPGAARGADPGECSEVSSAVREMVSSLKQRGWIGIEFEDERLPLRLTRVVTGSPAETAGLKPGDLWLGLDAYRFVGHTREEIVKQVKAAVRPGRPLGFQVARDGRELRLEVVPVPVPPPVIAQWIGQHFLEEYAEDLVEEVVEEDPDAEGAPPPGDRP